MTTVESEIVEFLKQFPETWFARKEVARKARSRHEFEADPNWATAPLNSLVTQHLVIQNESGLYKLKTEI